MTSPCHSTIAHTCRARWAPGPPLFIEEPDYLKRIKRSAAPVPIGSQPLGDEPLRLFTTCFTPICVIRCRQRPLLEYRSTVFYSSIQMDYRIDSDVLEGGTCSYCSTQRWPQQRLHHSWDHMFHFVLLSLQPLTSDWLIVKFSPKI